MPGCGRGTSGTASDPPAVGGLAHGRHPNLHAFDFQAVSTLLHAIGSGSGPQPPSCNAMQRLWPAMTAALPATDSEHRTGTDDEAAASMALHQCLISRLEGVDRAASGGRGQGAPKSYAAAGSGFVVPCWQVRAATVSTIRGGMSDAGHGWRAALQSIARRKVVCFTVV